LYDDVVVVSSLFILSFQRRFSQKYGERAIFWIRIKATGNVGHGSRFIKDQAITKVVK
jgi:hypothetical protein